VVSSILRIGPSPPLIRSYHHAFNLVNWERLFWFWQRHAKFIRSWNFVLML
jgi:hypothetical protein